MNYHNTKTGKGLTSEDVRPNNGEGGNSKAEVCCASFSDQQAASCPDTLDNPVAAAFPGFLPASSQGLGRLEHRHRPGRGHFPACRRPGLGLLAPVQLLQPVQTPAGVVSGGRRQERSRRRRLRLPTPRLGPPASLALPVALDSRRLAHPAVGPGSGPDQPERPLHRPEHQCPLPWLRRARDVDHPAGRGKRTLGTPLGTHAAHPGTLRPGWLAGLGLDRPRHVFAQPVPLPARSALAPLPAHPGPGLLPPRRKSQVVETGGLASF